MSFDIYIPLEDRVVIRPIKSTEPEKTAAGIITDAIKKEVQKGEVVSVGEGYKARDTGVFVPTVLHSGDIVLYGIHAGIEIEIPTDNGGKEECRLMRESDILIFISRKEAIS